jgi:hypothetical protein
VLTFEHGGRRKQLLELLCPIHLRVWRMTVFSVFLIAFFLLTSWLLCLEAYRGTEQDLPHVHRH